MIIRTRVDTASKNTVIAHNMYTVQLVRKLLIASTSADKIYRQITLRKLEKMPENTYFVL